MSNRRADLPLHIIGIVWILLWALFAVPWNTITPDAHWDRVSLIPFYPWHRLRDVVLNFIFYIPLGALAAAYGWRVLASMIAAALISGIGESLQVFTVHRYPSMTDIVTNVSGAMVGHVVFSRWRLRRRA